MTEALKITPTRFIASGGKLDSINRYVFGTTDNALAKFFLAFGPTMDTSGGGLKTVIGPYSEVDPQYTAASTVFPGASYLGITNEF